MIYSVCSCPDPHCPIHGEPMPTETTTTNLASGGYALAHGQPRKGLFSDEADAARSSRATPDEK